MANITHLLGALLVMLWFAVTIMGNTILGESILKLIPSPYAEDLMRYKWLILGFGIFLSITGFVNKIKQKQNLIRGRNRNDSRWQKHDSTIIRKDFESEQRKDDFLSSYENKSGDTSWEINIISHDAQRLNLMDHGNRKSIQEDAQKLGEFLSVPVWENTN